MSWMDRAAVHLVNKFGGDATLRTYTEGTYVDGEVIRTSEDIPVKAAMFDYANSGAGDKANFGTTILEGDKQCFMLPVSLTNPQSTNPDFKANRDCIVIAGVEWKVLTIKEINPTGVHTSVYDLHLRK